LQRLRSSLLNNKVLLTIMHTYSTVYAVAVTNNDHRRASKSFRFIQYSILEHSFFHSAPTTTTSTKVQLSSCASACILFTSHLAYESSSPASAKTVELFPLRWTCSQGCTRSRHFLIIERSLGEEAEDIAAVSLPTHRLS
jgi:hypothetical protein